MKNRNFILLPVAAVLTMAIVFSACRKINEPTELGGDLIPPVDNVNTFETYLDIETDNKLMTDTNRVYYDDDLAVGSITNDPEFGATTANAYFNISAASYGIYPFPPRDSLFNVDSVVLSLSYQGAFGDTLSTQTLRVFEIAQGSDFSDTAGFRYNHPAFATTGGELGHKTYTIKSLKDSVLFYRKAGDTTRLTNVIRIPLDRNFGVRLVAYDTSSNPFTGAYRDDTSFKKLFKGFAIIPDAGGQALTYFKPSDAINNKLIVYYRVKKGTGKQDTLATEFYHTTGGQANVITRNAGGGYASYLANPSTNDDKVYLQSTPGSYALLTIPGLSTFPNAVIHRAEIVINPLPSTDEKIFPPPAGLFLDRINATGDTAFTFDKDQSISLGSGFFTYDAATFGGLLRTDHTYRFNISRYVQNLITNHGTNYRLRLYAPVRAFLYSEVGKLFSQIYVNARPADGRVVLAGGSYADLAKRMRLRIVYSKL